MESKKVIREKILKKRTTMSVKKWSDASRVIVEKLISHPLFVMADEIYCYADCKGEVYTSDIFITAWKEGKKTAAPRIENGNMEFYYIEHFDDLNLGTYGIPEPITDEKANGKNVLVIMPGIAFDENKNRIGFGKGFYDKYLEIHPDYRRIALAFSLQMVENIPADAHDIRPEVIITEEQIYE